jgi:hypothetical protein
MNWKPVAVFVGGTALGFLLAAPGPIGSMIWPMAEGMPEPEGANLPLLMAMGFIEAAAFGLGLCWLVYGRNAAKALGGPGALGTALYVSVAWALMNWIPHSSLHMNHGNLVTPADFTGLVAIEYGFHFTLILAGACVAWCLYRLARGPVAQPTATPTKARVA